MPAPDRSLQDGSKRASFEISKGITSVTKDTCVDSNVAGPIVNLDTHGKSLTSVLVVHDKVCSKGPIVLRSRS